MKAPRLVVLSLVLSWLPAAAAAQVPVTQADLGRLDATAQEIRQQVLVLRSTDATLASDVEQSLAELADEIVYLRVKLRRGEAVTRADYGSLRDRLETLRLRATGDVAPVVRGAETGGAGLRVVPVGTLLDVRLQTALNSGTATLEQRFEATTVLDYVQGEQMLIPAGSLARGFISSVRAAGRIERRGSLTLSFDELRVGTTTYRLRASVAEAIDGNAADDMTRIGTAAVVGAILGGIVGGGKGALVGVLVGGGGTIAATEGADVELPPGTILRIRLDQAVEMGAP